jgi:hypothetical protein
MRQLEQFSRPSGPLYAYPLSRKDWSRFMSPQSRTKSCQEKRVLLAEHHSILQQMKKALVEYREPDWAARGSSAAV